MRALVAPQRFEGFYSDKEFKNLSVLGRWPKNMNIEASKYGLLRWVRNYKAAIFSKKKNSSDFDFKLQ
jgi:hypothetical protein